jgi:hypothetical protein
MVRALLIVLGCCLLFPSCECEYCEGASVDINITVLDMDNKPLSGKGVDQKDYTRFSQTAQTNEKGEAKMAFIWPSDTHRSWTLSVADATDYKTVNYVKIPYDYTPARKRISLIDTIRMDVLRPITVRFKTNRTDAKDLIMDVYSLNALADKQTRTFHFSSLIRSPTTPLDTTIQVNVYAKAAFYIYGRMNFSNTPLDSSKDKLIPNYARRDTVFLFEF